MQGVVGVIIAGTDGQVHKSTLTEQQTQEYARRIPVLAALASNNVRDLDPQDELQFLRVRSAKHEILVAPSECFAGHAAGHASS